MNLIGKWEEYLMPSMKQAFRITHWCSSLQIMGEMYAIIRRYKLQEPYNYWWTFTRNPEKGFQIHNEIDRAS